MIANGAPFKPSKVLGLRQPSALRGKRLCTGPAFSADYEND